MLTDARTSRLAVVVLLLGSLTTRGEAQADSLPARVDALFASARADSLPGCVIGVDRPGHPTFYRTFGVTNLENPTPIDTGTIFEAGSVSKQFTAAAVVMLARAGKLSLDDQVRHWLPELSTALPPMTIRQLLHHESGWRDWGDLVELAGWPRGTRTFTMPDALALLARQRYLNYKPGAEFLYSNSNFVLAALIVERASGQSFTDYTRQALFTPLGMTHTWWRADFSIVLPHRAAAWSSDAAGHWHLDMPFENVIGHGGMLTTVPDLLRWQANFLTGAVGGPELVREMQTPGRFNNGARNEYALGLDLYLNHGQPAVSHSGATAGYRAFVGRAPERRIAVALLCNNGDLSGGALGSDLLDLAMGFAPPDRTVRAPDLGAAMASPWNGTFRNERTERAITVAAFARGLAVDGRTGYRARNDSEFVDSTDGGILRLYPAMKGLPPLFRIVDTTISDSVTYTRVEPWSPSPASLARYAGKYWSDEIDAEWVVAFKGGELIHVSRDGFHDPLTPVYRDAFTTASGWLVLFRRDGRIIVGMDVGRSRTRKVGFRRE